MNGRAPHALVLAVTVAVALSISISITERAAAQPAPGPDARATADALFSAGQDLMAAGRFAEACRKLEESYRIEAAGGTLLNLALCHEKEGRIASAWAEYRESAVVARRVNRPDREKAAQEAMLALEPKLPHLTLHVPDTTRVPGLQIFRNGVELTQPSWGIALPIDPGEVAIEVRAPGHVTWRGTVTAKIAETSELTIAALERAPAPPPEPTPPPRIVVIPPLEQPSWWTGRRTAGVSLVAAGVVSLGVGTYFGLRSLAKRSTSDDGCPSLDGQTRCTVAGASAMSDAQRYAWFSDVGLGLGAAFAIAGAALLVTAPSPSPSPSPSPLPSTGATPVIRVGAAPTLGGGTTFVTGTW